MNFENLKYLFEFFVIAIEAQSKAMRDDRRREDDEARGTRFGEQILDTEVYQGNTKTDYFNSLPGNDDEDVCSLFIINYS